jgi:hypothetical protein
MVAIGLHARKFRFCFLVPAFAAALTSSSALFSQTLVELASPFSQTPTDESLARPEAAFQTLHAFLDQDLPLTWQFSALPTSELTLEAKVFAVGGSLAAPLPQMGFSISGKVAADQIRTELRHPFPAPGGVRPQTFLVRWLAKVSGEETARTGAIRIQYWPHGLLNDLKQVWLPERPETVAFRAALEADKVQVFTLLEAEQPPADWQGLHLVWPANKKEAETAPLPKLTAGQIRLELSPPQSPPGLIAHPHGAGRLIQFPERWLALLPTQPALQRLLREACFSQDPNP